MKNKILILIIGIIIGSIITTSAFLIYNKVFIKNLKGQETMQINGREQMQPPSLPDGNDGTLPEKPSNSNNNNIVGSVK